MAQLPLNKRYDPTIGQLAAAEELLGAERLNALLSFEEISVTQNEMLKLYAIINDCENTDDVEDAPIEEVQSEIAFFFAQAASKSKQAKSCYPVFLLMNINSAQMETAIRQLESIYPGMEAEAGNSLAMLLQKLSKITAK